MAADRNGAALNPGTAGTGYHPEPARRASSSSTDIGGFGISVASASLPFERIADRADLLVGQMLDADAFRTRLVDRAEQLVELCLDRRPVAILTVLDQEHRQEGRTVVALLITSCQVSE